MAFDRHVESAFRYMKLPSGSALKAEQLGVLRSLYNGRDTIAVLPTGYGKSLIYQMLPYMMAYKNGEDKPKIVIVVTPITAIMEEQVQMLMAKGIKACFLKYALACATTYGDEEEEEQEEKTSDEGCELLLPKEVTLQQLKAGEYNIIFTHPETLFNVKSIATLIRSPLYRRQVCAIVIDEAHIIKEWGPEFRTKFGQLGDLMCLHPDAAHLAMTATAKPEAINILSKSMNFESPHVIAVNPDRPNIFIEITSRPPNCRKMEKYISFIKPLSDELKLKLNTFPVTVAYVESLEALGFCYKYINSVLKKDQYNGKTHVPEHRIFAQYHTDYTLDMKRLIISELSRSIPTVRLVLATVAIGMGLNSPSIVRIIHMRPPLSLEHYMQEIGRAGRTGQPATATMYYNRSDIASNRKGITAAMVDFCLTEDTCLRLQLVKYFGFEQTLFNGNPGDCCINCKTHSLVAGESKTNQQQSC